VTAAAPVRSDDDDAAGVGSASDQPDASAASQETVTAAAPVRSDDDDAAGVGSASDQPDASDSEPA